MAIGDMLTEMEGVQVIDQTPTHLVLRVTAEPHIGRVTQVYEVAGWIHYDTIRGAFLPGGEMHDQSMTLFFRHPEGLSKARAEYDRKEKALAEKLLRPQQNGKAKR